MRFQIGLAFSRVRRGACHYVLTAGCSLESVLSAALQPCLIPVGPEYP